MSLFVDMVLNGAGHGEVAQALQQAHFDPGVFRPFIGSDGRKYVTVINSDGKKETVTVRDYKEATGFDHPVLNASSLRKEEWTRIDAQVQKVARLRLRAWSDLAASNLYRVNGMAMTMLEHESMNDPGSAQVDMDALTEGKADTPLFSLQGIPLPITHGSFFYSSRTLQISRTRGSQIDTVMAEAVARRIAETIEGTVIGTITGIRYGTSAFGYTNTAQVYGYTNFPQRLTKTDLTAPTGSNPEATVQDVLEMLEQMSAQNFYGPFMLYHSTDWDKYLDNDYARLGGNNATMTLRERLKKIEGIQDVRRIDSLKSATNPFTFILVQMTSDVAQAIEGMPMQTIQWDSRGGLQTNFKVMTIMVPRLRADGAGQCGILHATTS